MRNSLAECAGVPAPFENLVPLIHYLDLLERVVDTPTDEYVEAYVVYDRDVFTPVVVTSLERRHRKPVTSRSCILYDAVQDSHLLERDVRNSARCTINSLVSYIASSGAFPANLVGEAYEMLDLALVDIVGDDKARLAFARKRMRMSLLNVWVRETQWSETYHTGDHEEILRNVELGWKHYGAPYGARWIAKLAGSVNFRRYY